MTIYSMSDTELAKFQVIQDLNAGKLNRRQAGELLNLSVRQVQRLHNRFRSLGVSGLVSQKRGKPSNRRYPDTLKEHVLYGVLGT